MNTSLKERVLKELEISDESFTKEELDRLSLLGEKSLSDSKNFNSAEYGKISKEVEKLQKKLGLINSLKILLADLDSTENLLTDLELGGLAKDDIKKLEQEATSKLAELEKLNVKKLDNDDSKAIIEIRPGVGGVEAALFAEDLFKAYLASFSKSGIKIEVYTIDYNVEGGINLAIFLVDLPGSFGLLRFEGGVHRVQRVPSTETLGRIHTSTASIVVMPQFDNIDIKIEPSDLRIDVYRATGPGGQSVNTTDSAVRITHLPSKITVTCQNSKSQHKNKEFAMSVLKSRLYEIELAKKQVKEKNIRLDSIQGGDRSAKIRTYNFPQSRITDHRIGKSWFNINEVMAGGIGDIVEESGIELRKLN